MLYKLIDLLIDSVRVMPPILSKVSASELIWYLGSQPATDSHTFSARLQLLSTWPSVTFSAAEHHLSLDDLIIS